MKFYRQYKDEQGKEEITREELSEVLSRYYKESGEIIKAMEEGKIEEVSTPWAIFRAEL